MKPILLSCLLLFSLGSRAQLLPDPVRIADDPGTFTLDRSTTVCYDSALEPLVDYLENYLPGLPRNCSYADANTLALHLDPSLGEEAYALRIRPTHIEIAGGGYGGVFNGVQSLLQLLPPQVYAGQADFPLTIACRTVEDAPRFAYRGMMLDVARTWIDADRLMRYIDLFAYHKINKLHLHLSDDEGWRIRIESHPELTDIGAYRGGDSPIRSVYGKWGEKYGGYYTQQQMRRIIDYAARRNIEIIPEIDLPGHSRNIAQVHPEILCDYAPDTVASAGYDLRSAWCVAREENYALLEDILNELCDLFPSPYIHIGGDEVEHEQWMRCPRCRKLMERKGIEDPDALQQYFMLRLATILNNKGKKPAVWNESIRSGGLADARVHGWENTEACLAATRAGYRTVVMPAQYFYLDMRQSPREEGHDWAAVVTPERLASFDFAARGFTPEQMECIEGMEATFWSEAYVSHEPEKPDYLDYMLFPRLAIFASMAWEGRPQTELVTSPVLRDLHFERLGSMGVHYRLFPPEVDYRDGLLTARCDDPRAELRYAVDPSDSLRAYDGPIRTAHPERYRFRTVRGTGRSPWSAVEAYYRTIRPAVRLTSSLRESRRAPFSRVEEYRTFAWTTRTCRQGDWLLFSFDSPVQCREIKVQTGNRQLPKCIFTTGRVEVSYDGTSFEPAGELEAGAFMLRPQRPVHALRVVSTCDDNGCAFVTIQPLAIRP